MLSNMGMVSAEEAASWCVGQIAVTVMPFPPPSASSTTHVHCV